MTTLGPGAKDNIQSGILWLRIKSVRTHTVQCSQGTYRHRLIVVSWGFSAATQFRKSENKYAQINETVFYPPPLKAQSLVQ